MKIRFKLKVFNKFKTKILIIKLIKMYLNFDFKL